MKPIKELRHVDLLADPAPQVNAIIDTVNELVRRENARAMAKAPALSVERINDALTPEAPE